MSARAGALPLPDGSDAHAKQLGTIDRLFDEPGCAYLGYERIDRRKTARIAPGNDERLVNVEKAVRQRAQSASRRGHRFERALTIDGECMHLASGEKSVDLCLRWHHVEDTNARMLHRGADEVLLRLPLHRRHGD